MVTQMPDSLRLWVNAVPDSTPVLPVTVWFSKLLGVPCSKTYQTWDSSSEGSTEASRG